MSGMRLHNSRIAAAWGAARDQRGFTLVETIVASVILVIVFTAVVGILAFSARNMAYQREHDNAATLASTVKTTLEGTLRSAREFNPPSDKTDSNALYFTTTKKTDYLGNAGTHYKLYLDGGQLYIQEADEDGDAVGTSGGLLPAKTYIDGDFITWSISSSDNTVTIFVYPSGEENPTADNYLAKTTADIEEVNAS